MNKFDRFQPPNNPARDEVAWIDSIRGDAGVVEADPRLLTDEEEQELLANLHYEQQGGS